MVLDCVRVAVDVFKVVVETFEVVLGGFRSFHILVRTDLYKLIIYQSLPQKTLFGAIYGTNWLTRSKLSFILSSGRCFTEVATYFKSYWKHWNWPPQRVQRLMFGALAPLSRGWSKDQSLRQRAYTQNISLYTLIRWPIYIFNSVDNTKLPCYTLPPTQHHSFFRNLLVDWISLLTFFKI